MQRNRFTQTTSLGDRLAHEAERLRKNARTVPVGKERESLLRKARQLETASHVNEWLSTPGPATAAVTQNRCVNATSAAFAAKDSDRQRF